MQKVHEGKCPVCMMKFRGHFSFNVLCISFYSREIQFDLSLHDIPVTCGNQKAEVPV